MKRKNLLKTLLCLFALMPMGAWAEDAVLVETNYAKLATDNFTYGTTVQVARGTVAGQVNGQNVSPFSYTNESNVQIINENDILVNRDVYFRFEKDYNIGLYQKNATQYGVRNLKAGDKIYLATNDGGSSSVAGVKPESLQNVELAAGTSTYTHAFQRAGSKTLGFTVYTLTVKEDGLAGFQLTGAYVGYIKVTRSITNTSTSIKKPRYEAHGQNPSTTIGTDIITGTWTDGNMSFTLTGNAPASGTKTMVRVGSTTTAHKIHNYVTVNLNKGSGTDGGTYQITKSSNIKSVTMYAKSSDQNTNGSIYGDYGLATQKTLCNITDETFPTRTATTPLSFDITNYSNIHIEQGVYATFEIDYYQDCNLSVADVEWASLCLPFDAEIPENVKVYYAKSTTNNVITLKEIETSIPANTGVLVNATTGIYSFTYTSDTPNVLPSTNLFEGVTETTNLTKGENYVLAGAENENANPVFKLYGTGDGTIELAAYKVYLPKANVPNAGSSKEIKFTFDGETTGISAIDNGQWTKENNAPIYNMAGQRVGKNYKGIVIQNGKKFINK